MSDDSTGVCFNERLRSLQRSLVAEVDREFDLRTKVSLQENARLREENAKLKSQLVATGELHQSVRTIESKCQRLEREKQEAIRQLDLSRRQMKEYLRANHRLKAKASHAETTARELERRLNSLAHHVQAEARSKEAVHQLRSALASFTNAIAGATGSDNLQSPLGAEPDQLISPPGVCSPHTKPASLRISPAHPTPANGTRDVTGSPRAAAASAMDDRREETAPAPGPPLEDRRAPQDNLSARRAIVPSSQSTEDNASLDGDDRLPLPIKAESEVYSSPPTVTHIRHVRRPGNTDKKATPLPISKDQVSRHDGSVTKPFVVKEERHSSPIGLSAYPLMAPPLESIDLDEIGNHVQTPHKRRQLAQQLSMRLPEGLSIKQASHLGFERARSMPSTVPYADSVTEILDGRTGPLRRLQQSQQEPAAEAEVAPEPSTPPTRRKILQPMTSNEQNRLHLGVPILIPDPKDRATSKGKIKDFAEDGEPLSITSQRELEANMKRAADGIHQMPEDSRIERRRIEGLLAQPSPQGHEFTPPIKSETGGARNKRKSHPVTSESLMTPSGSRKQQKTSQWFETTSRTSPRRPKAKRFQTVQDPSSGSKAKRTLNSFAAVADAERPRSPSPSEEPLRARPMQTLNLSDFKINPDISAGQEYAFTETVRKGTEKKCLPGCTDARCCGKHFLQLARMGVTTPGSHSKRSFMEGTPSQEEPLPEGVANQEELAILQQELGSGFPARQRIAEMSAVERADRVLQAKAAALAQQHGRHRQRFERRTSPDGFWDTEFPSTQKVQQNKEAAKFSDREKLELRYREALKGRAGKGRFLFRDE